MRVYCLFEITRHEDILVAIYSDRSIPDKIAAENPMGAMDGYYVSEWEVK